MKKSLSFMHEVHSKYIKKEFLNNLCGICNKNLSNNLNEHLNDHDVFAALEKIVYNNIPYFTVNFLQYATLFLDGVCQRGDKNEIAMFAVEYFKLMTTLFDNAKEDISIDKEPKLYYKYFRRVIPICKLENKIVTVLRAREDILNSSNCAFLLDKMVNYFEDVQNSFEDTKKIVIREDIPRRHRRERRVWATNLHDLSTIKIYENENEKSFGIISFNQQNMLIFTKRHVELKENYIYEAQIRVNTIDFPFEGKLEIDKTGTDHIVKDINKSYPDNYPVENNDSIVNRIYLKTLSDKGFNLYVVKYHEQQLPSPDYYFKALCRDQFELERDFGTQFLLNVCCKNDF